MSNSDFNYKGHHVVIDDAGGVPANTTLSIDGENVDLIYDADAKCWVAIIRDPYLAFDSVDVLAKNVIDDVLNQ